MLKIGDKVRCIKAAGRYVHEGAEGIVVDVYEQPHVCEDSVLARGLKVKWLNNCMKNKDNIWTICERKVVKIMEGKEYSLYNLEEEIQKLKNKGYDVDGYIEQAKEFYREEMMEVEYDIDIDDILFVKDDIETMIGHIDSVSNEWLKEILLNVIEQRNELQDEINDLKDEIKEMKDERESMLEFIQEGRF